jgi:hypothetical protein
MVFLKTRLERRYQRSGHECLRHKSKKPSWLYETGLTLIGKGAAAADKGAIVRVITVKGPDIRDKASWTMSLQRDRLAYFGDEDPIGY